MKKIQIKPDVFTLVDDDDYPVLSQYKWSLNGAGYVHRCVRGVTVFMHRLIMRAPRLTLVDHINKDILDNRKENLRLCTERQNHMNRIPHKDKPIQIKGVYTDKREPLLRYYAQIKVGRRRISKGNYATIEEAAEQRRLLEEKYFGAFASK